MFCVALCDDNEDFLKLEDLVVHQYMEQKHIDCQIEHFKDGEALLLQSVENYDLVLLDVEMGKSVCCFLWSGSVGSCRCRCRCDDRCSSLSRSWCLSLHCRGHRSSR